MIEVHGSPAPPPAPSGTAPSRRRRAWLALVALAVAAGALGVPIYAEIRARATSDANLRRATDEVAVPIVNVVRPRPGAVAEELVLPGNTQAYTDAPIYARTSGYLHRWYFDLGARVKRGDLLAEIDAPEVDRQLQQARADLQNAEANLHQAEITAQRWQALLESQAVSQQETDQAVNTLRAMKATVASSAANVQRLEELKAFQRINAPFDGVITARRTDVGALIDAGANTQGQELFHISAIDRLRVFIAVPQVYSQAARPGAKARLTLAELPG